MKKQQVTVVFLLLFMASFATIMTTGCNKESDTTPATEQETTTRPVVKTTSDGIPVFSDRKSFHDAYRYLDAVDGNDSYPEFNSMGQALQDFEDNDNLTQHEEEVWLKENRYTVGIGADSTVEAVVEDPYFAKLMRHDGVFIIKDTIFIIDREYLRSIPLGKSNGNLEEYRRYTTSQNDVTVFPIEREVMTTYRCGKKCTNNYSHNRRIKGKIWRINFGIIKSFGATTTAQKKRWFFWKGNKVDWVTVNIGVSGHSPKSKTRYNKKRATIVWDWWVGESEANNNAPQIPADGLSFEAIHRIPQAICDTCR